MVTHVCPICGAAPELKINSFDYHYECSGCGIIKSAVFCSIYISQDKAKSNAAEDWNEVAEYVESLIKNKGEGKKE